MLDVFSSIIKFESWFQVVFWSSIFSAIIFYICIRAGSSYSILNRVWRMFLGNDEFQDVKIKKYWKERIDVEHFNMLYNIKARNGKEIKKFIGWVECNNVDVVKISKASKWFDVKTCTLKSPSKFTTISLFLLMVISYIFFHVTLTLALTPSALLKFNKDESWVWVNEKSAENYIPKLEFSPFQIVNWTITPQDCKGKSAKISNDVYRSGISKDTAKKICNIFTSKNDKNAIADIIKKQRGFYVLSFFLLSMCVCFIRNLMQRMTALTLIKNMHY